MYKNYPPEEYRKVADECKERLRALLQARYDELEEFREAINDRYPYEDLFLKWAEVDYEEELIKTLLKYLEICKE